MLQSIKSLIPLKLKINLYYQMIRLRGALDKGNNVECNICGSHFSRFSDFGSRPSVLCPTCFSLERHRLQFAYLTQHSGIFTDSLKVLHFAPEKCLHEKISQNKKLEYETADLLIQFIDMTKCLAMGTPDDLINHLQRFHSYIGTIDWDGLRKEVEVFATRFRAKDVAELEYGELIGELLALGRAYRVRPVTDMMLVFVALITAQGIGKLLEPKLDVFGSVAMFLMPILMKRNETIPATSQAQAARASAS
jgi:hypothetical protein